MKKIIYVALVPVTFILWVAIAYIAPDAYVDERCITLQKHLNEKADAAKRGQDLYPGFTVTEKLGKICPGIHE